MFDQTPHSAFLSAPVDAELIADSIEGDLRAFGLLVSKYQRDVVAAAYKVCSSQAIAEDAAQETFVVAWKKLDQLENSTKLRAWLCGISRRRASDAMRKRKREVLGTESDSGEWNDTLSESPSPFEQTADRQRKQKMWRNLEELPQVYREPMLLFYERGLNVRQVGEILELSLEAVKQRLRRGREHLRAASVTGYTYALIN